MPQEPTTEEQLHDLESKIRILNSQIKKRIDITNNTFSSLKRLDDPSVGMPLTDEQIGLWKGRREIWDFIHVMSKEIFGQERIE